MKLGKKSPVIDARVPLLSHRMKMVKPAPSVDWTKAVKSWPVLANDQIGDCTSAGCLHQLSLWYANNGFDYQPTDSEAIALYSATSDYPKEDGGAVEQAVLKYWATTGLVTPLGTDVVTFAALNPKDINELKLSVQFFGGCYLGIALPLTAQTQPEIWDVTPADTPENLSAPGSWGGHCVIAVAYDEQYVTVVSWGQLIKATPAFLQKYMDENYALVSRDWLSNSGISPPGLNWQALMDDMKAITD